MKTRITIAALISIVVCLLEIWLLSFVRTYILTHPGLSDQSQGYISVAWFIVALWIIPTLWIPAMAGILGEEKTPKKVKLC